LKYDVKRKIQLETNETTVLNKWLTQGTAAYV